MAHLRSQHHRQPAAHRQPCAPVAASALNQDMLFQRTLGHEWKGNADLASMRRLPDGDLEVFCCEWRAGVEAQIQITTTVTTADRHSTSPSALSPRTGRHSAPQPANLLPHPQQTKRRTRVGERIVGRIKGSGRPGQGRPTTG